MTILAKIESIHDRKQLLQYARATAAQKLGTSVDQANIKPEIGGCFGGAFVTFWAGKKLRGCVGTFNATEDIAHTIEEVTRASLEDPRFAAHPVTAEELPSLQIEISILSDTEPIADPLSLILGQHGLVIRKGAKSGCFLPHVATQRGWSAATFLSNCCSLKAGLPPDAWRDPDTEVLVFSADVFSESDFA